MQGERRHSLRTLAGNLLILAGVRLLPKIAARSTEFDVFTDEQIAVELLEQIWVELPLGSRDAFLVESAVDRLVRTRACGLIEAKACRPLR